MKRHFIKITLLLVIALSSAPSFAETVRVVTKENAIREDCRFLAPIKNKVQYGDELDVSAKEGDWFKVKFRNIKGCIHKNAVTDKTVALSDVSSKGHTASSDEVALAGKGFNPEVEKSYKSKHPELDFNAVNGIEEYRVSEESLKIFIKAGGLNQP